MAITQMYDKGQKFETYTKDQLLSSVWGSLSTDFIWEGRTLSCYRIPGEDGKLSSGYDVPIGAEMSSNLEEQNIYGIWTMDKSPDPVKVYFIGDSGEVSVDVVEQIVSPPLADYNRIKNITHTVSNTDSNYHEITVYRQPESKYGAFYNKILFKIRKSAATTVLSVCHQNYLMDLTQSNDFNMFLASEADAIWKDWLEWPTSPNCKNWDASPLTKQYGLSVFFSEQGRLTYYPNKDYVNP